MSFPSAQTNVAFSILRSCQWILPFAASTALRIAWLPLPPLVKYSAPATHIAFPLCNLSRFELHASVALVCVPLRSRRIILAPAPYSAETNNRFPGHQTGVATLIP